MIRKKASRPANPYVEELRKLRSTLLVTALKKRDDLRVRKIVDSFTGKLNWEPPSDLMIEEDVWGYITKTMGYSPQLVFCHPDLLLRSPTTSFYYRGLSGLSLKAAKDYIGAVEALEEGKSAARLNRQKALAMARTYNTFTCSIIKNSTDWTLENGYRTIIATLGATLDGKMRNRVGDIAEDRIRTLLIEWLASKKLLAFSQLAKDRNEKDSAYEIKGGIEMRFGSEPDVAFTRGEESLATIEIKGGIDPAGALERYGAATKSFQHAVKSNARCKNFYLGAVFTPELRRRIEDDRLVEKTFNIVDMLADPGQREQFFRELFHHTLRVL